MTQAERIKKAVGEFGASAKAKLSGSGQQPEDQLRNPLELGFVMFYLGFVKLFCRGLI